MQMVWNVSIFFANGVFNDYSCYNNPLCGYNGGDCCKDTFQTKSSFIECGHNGFYCRDPQSEVSNPRFSKECKTKPYINSTIPDKPV